MNSLKNERMVKLKEWGCDIDSALDRTLNDEEFYFECLNDIMNDMTFNTLVHDIENKDIDKAFFSAHGLKGVLANLGLTPLLNKTIEIVEELRKKSFEGLNEKCQQLIEMKNKLQDIIK